MHDHPTWKLRRRTGKETAVKVEPKEEQLETTNHLLHSPLPPPPQGWEHPAELDYLDASTWSKDDIIRHLITNSFSVPALVPHSKWTTIITAAEGSTTMLPNSYRIPLMFVGEFMWFSLRLVLEDEKEWEKFKGGVLHVSRLCEAFLGEARRAMGSEGLGAAWRCAVFDRALVRYRWGCLFSDRKHLQLFWETYGEQEYRKDPVKFFWNRVALKGRKEFKLDKEHIETGVTACQWMRGLAKEDGGDWVWVTDQTSSRSTEASEYLELWQRTKVWGQPIPTLPSRDPVCAIGPSPNLSKDLPTPFDAIQSPSRGPDQPTQISCISRPREPVFATTTDPPPTDTIHSTPTPVPKTDLLQILHAQYQSIQVHRRCIRSCTLCPSA
ncbi:uncharacterized protein BT62DRAFT_575631 [Guyanagaster necrorhizus]|uniref:Uncharacterized protein n=1 Tax=Guyanagaster necrorhizus TaxID=856835 RepID=A0A9P7VIQ2_9AGAR|nr:uncharacterized protein BT62DRAFT_575631 [Guyanagaster necrorhizus MCA 3950]KAG7440684.1 hypothetical protein BT62DRAFT_575631 [Guyanagaster necrorhizus MCA 3950]